MDVSELTKNITALAASGQPLPEKERVKLYSAITQLRDAIESPLEATFRFAFGAHDAAALAIGINMELFDISVTTGHALTVDDFAEKASADALLVGRVLNMLTGLGLFRPEATEKYIATPLGSVYATGSPLRDCIIHLQSHNAATAKLPEYFRLKGYENPDDAYESPWQFSEKTDKHYFDWLAEYPHLQDAFNTALGLARLEPFHWSEFYPIKEKLQGTSNETLLVDIGGGIGHDVIAFREKNPDITGKLIFEDLPMVVESSKRKELPQGIEGVGHDFFQPQPDAVKGAKFYYLRTVLHDFPDKQARVIIKHVRDIMTEGSVLLINEKLMPERDVSLLQARLDWNMMVCFSSLDRTERQFKELLESEGFRTTGTYRPQGDIPGSPTLLEFVLAK
ncbi:S-adenosyl-L-methionine-dependent methyltransferase [Corynespora cassiicola Philippines]|uniref:S-adenosyl-L-methionine-dependent methyltransferase n=1 Tax=Corynespora cassiicola Philippines TaxID=1448308 RepID=A0A2T2NCP1_CORCC|nr:S-adenosyl-L-methionine-dependent methyltransferase [Corynespora cassiicola Philippines]